MTWLYPELIERVQAVLPPGLTILTQLPANQAAWLSVPVFAYAKQFDEPLPTIGRAIAKRIEALGDVSVEVEGGFVNVTPASTFVSQSLTEAAEPTFGSSAIGNGAQIIVELSSPNVAKPMSIGHLRSTIIGDALQRVYRALGYAVTSVNHLGDWGTQFGRLLAAYERTFGTLEPRPMTILELVKLYVDFHAAEAANPTLTEAARVMFQRLEAGDAVVRTLWQQFVDLSVIEFQRMYDRLSVVIDETVGESQYESVVPRVLRVAQDQGLTEESDGALIIRVPGEPVPLMLRKRDGTTTYATRDLAQVLLRVETYAPAAIVYVVANEQSLHFVQYHTVAKLLGFVPNTKLIHVKFGLVRLLEGKMSTRAGRVVLLEDVLNEAVARAAASIAASDGAPKQSAAIAETVGIAAVKFFDLLHDRNHDIVFDWDRMLSLKGDSAPYLLYSYARAASILRKAGAAPLFGKEGRGEISDLTDNENSPNPLLQRGNNTSIIHHSSLVRILAKFPLILETVVADNAPHHLAQYLNQVASEFHRFYEQFPVLSSEGEERQTRLAIVAATANVLKLGLNLLGIDVLEEM